MNIENMIKETNTMLNEIHSVMPDTAEIEKMFLGIPYLPVSVRKSDYSQWNVSLKMQDARGIFTSFECDLNSFNDLVESLKDFCKNNDISVEEVESE